MRDYLYVNKRNERKCVEVRRYDCGHYYAKQYIKVQIPEEGKNYTGCSLKQNRRGGVWKKVSKKFLLECIVGEYQLEV